MTQEFRTFTQRLNDKPNKKTRIFNVQAKTIVDRFGNDIVGPKGNKIWFPLTFDPAAAIAFGRSLASANGGRCSSLGAQRNARRAVGSPAQLQRTVERSFRELVHKRCFHAFGLIGAAARLSSSGNIRDAVALYNARKSKR